MSSALLALHTAVFSTLTADGTLATLLHGGSGIRDAIPKSPSYPLVVIGDSVEVPDRYFQQLGHEILCEVAIYTRDGSTATTGPRRGVTGFSAGLAIFDRVTTLLVGTPAVPRTWTMSGYSVVDVDVDFAQTSRDTDGITRVVDARYRVRVEAA